MEHTPEQELKKLAEDLTKATDEVKKFAETVQTEMKNLGTLIGGAQGRAVHGQDRIGGTTARASGVGVSNARPP